jgi:hypothetical protein
MKSLAIFRSGPVISRDPPRRARAAIAVADEALSQPADDARQRKGVYSANQRLIKIPPDFPAAMAALKEAKKCWPLVM